MNISTDSISRLLRWYAENGRRSLPWRQEPTPYRVWVSEIMLQQTQVKTVLDYYSRFLSAFPDVQTLAEAEEETVLRQWEGLGYYRRARQMRKAAQCVVQNHGGRFPETFSDLLALPGIGRYSAGAILSFAFDKRFPILEANTRRLFARLKALELSLSSASAQKLLWQTAEEFVSSEISSESPRLLNTALTDLGSLVCTPQNPLCEKCPLQLECEARQRNLTARIPVSAPKIKYEERQEAVALLVRHDAFSEKKNLSSAAEREFLLVQYVEGEWWAGLWDFPRTEIKNKESLREELQAFVLKNLSLEINPTEEIGVIRHSVTKYRILLHVFRAELVASEQAVSQKSVSKQAVPKQTGPEPLPSQQAGPEQVAQNVSWQTPTGGKILWVPESTLETFPLCSSGRQIARKLL